MNFFLKSIRIVFCKIAFMKRKLDECEEKLTFFCATNARGEYQYVCGSALDSDEELETAANAASASPAAWRINRTLAVPTLIRIIERIMPLARGRNFMLGHGFRSFDALFDWESNKPSVCIYVGSNGPADKLIIGFTTHSRREPRRMRDILELKGNPDERYTIRIPVLHGATLPEGHASVDWNLVMTNHFAGRAQPKFHLFASKTARVFYCSEHDSSAIRAMKLLQALAESPGLCDVKEQPRTELRVDPFYTRFIKRAHFNESDVVVLTPWGTVLYSSADCIPWKINVAATGKMLTCSSSKHLVLPQSAVVMQPLSFSVYEYVDADVTLDHWFCSVPDAFDFTFLVELIPPIIDLIVGYAAYPYVAV